MPNFFIHRNIYFLAVMFFSQVTVAIFVVLVIYGIAKLFGKIFLKKKAKLEEKYLPDKQESYQSEEIERQIRAEYYRKENTARRLKNMEFFIAECNAYVVREERREQQEKDKVNLNDRLPKDEWKLP